MHQSFSRVQTVLTDKNSMKRPAIISELKIQDIQGRKN